MSSVTGTIKDIKYSDSDTKILLKSKESFIVYYNSIVDYKIGDKIEVVGKFNELKNNTLFNTFNYKKYLLSKNIHYTIKAEEIKLIKVNKNILYKIKNWIINRVNNAKNKEYLYAMVLGDNSYIDKSVLQSYRVNGISHLFSISGMHIGFISGILLYILNRMKSNNFNYLIVILFLVFFLFLVGFIPSAIRAVLLFSFIFLNKLFKINLTTFKTLLLILIINLLINPYNIYNIGFKFSYVISLFLIRYSCIIKNYKNYFLKILATSFISFLCSIPIMINNYFSINIMSILNNLVFVPIVSLIIFPFSFIAFLIPKLSFLYSFVINILEKTSLFIAKYSLIIVLKKPSIIVIILYYLLIILILNKISKKKYKYMILIIVALLIHTNIDYISNTSTITFLNVGQGDSSLIHLTHNKSNILIDTGGNKNNAIYKDIISLLQSNGITEIDYLIITHGDYDHMGEAINLVNNFKVEKVIFNCGEYNDLEKELIKVLDKKKIPYYSCINELNIDKNKLYFLQTKEYDNENDNSNVIYTEINGYKFMFMGDASVTTEQEILNKYNLPNIDVLKVGHHGSKTSSGKDFINEINPKYSIISVGKKNRYGHPNKEVLDVLKNSKIYRTDEDGSIMFKIKNNKLKIETCKP